MKKPGLERGKPFGGVVTTYLRCDDEDCSTYLIQFQAKSRNISSGQPKIFFFKTREASRVSLDNAEGKEFSKDLILMIHGDF
jgi:hypothetical protein